MRSFVDISALKPLKVVADTANGMGGLVAPAVFEGLPFEVEILYAELDGTFPNHPADPIQPENQRRPARASHRDRGRRRSRFRRRRRPGLSSWTRRVPSLVPGSTTTALVAAGILNQEPGATILHNLICSKAVPEVVTELGGSPVRTRVGHSYIKQQMAETGAAFAGEHSGHYYFRDNYRADSGLIARARGARAGVSRRAQPLSTLRRPYERYAPSGEINFEVGDQEAVLAEVAAAYPDALPSTTSMA